jgi:hypothetical protein
MEVMSRLAGEFTLGGGNMALYAKPVKLLFRDMVEDLGSAKGAVIERDAIHAWFEEKYPLVKPGTVSAHILRMSVNAPSRIHYNVDPTGKDDLLFQIDKQNFRLYDPTMDPSPIYIRSKEMVEENDEIDNEKGREFAYERDLQNFLSRNLFLIDSGLTLYCEEDVSGLEFPVGNRFIDILAVDGDNNYVVIELKVSRGYDRTVGQLLRYMAWIRKYHAEQTQTVRGVIVAREISDDLLLACSEIDNIDLYEYQLSVSLKRIGLDRQG